MRSSRQPLWLALVLLHLALGPLRASEAAERTVLVEVWSNFL